MPQATGCTYVLLAGLPGTGKSTLAAVLAAELAQSGNRAVILSKDEVRKALFPGTATDYSEAQNDLCMGAILQAADYLRHQPDGPAFVLFDGRTFSRSEHIERVIAAAEAGHSAWRILHLVCPEGLAEQRLSTATGHPATDRTFALYLEVKKKLQPINRPHLLVNTSAPIVQCTRECLRYLVDR